MKGISSPGNVLPGVLSNFISRSWLLLFARVTQVGAVFLIFWLYSLRLPKEMYGTYQKVFVLIGLCTSLSALGLPLLISSLPATQTGRLVLAIWKKTRWIYTGVFVVIGVLLYNALPFLSFGLRLLTLTLCVAQAGYIVLEILLIKRGKDRIIFGGNLLYTLLFAAIHIGVLLRPVFSLPMLLISLGLLSGCRWVVGIWWWFRSGGVGMGNADEASGAEAPDLATMGLAGSDAAETLTDHKVQPLPVYVRLWGFLSVNETLEAFSANIDNFFLLWLLSSTAFATYFNGSYEVPLTGLLVTVAGTFLNVQIKKYALGNTDIVRLFHSVALILSFLLFPLFFFAQFHAGELFSLFFHGRYNDSVPIFLVSSWIIPFRIANYTVILQHQLKGNLILRGSVTGLAAKMLLCPVGYACWGVRGVAAAIVLATVIQIGYYLYQSAARLQIKVYRIMPFRLLFLLFLVCGAIAWLGASLLSTLSPSYRLGAGIGILLLSAGILLWRYYKRLLCAVAAAGTNAGK